MESQPQRELVREEHIRASLDQHWAASDANDFETEHLIYHEDAVLEYPQSLAGLPCRGFRETLYGFLSQPHLSFGRHLISINLLACIQMVRIRVVDDYEPVRRSIQILLGSHEGWVVCGEAADGFEAVKQAKLLRPDLIIMDVSMPNMNGLDAAETIFREVFESRILIISQNDPEIVRRQAVEAHAHGFLEKSSIQRSLIAAVESILSRDGQSKTENAG